MMVVNLSDRWVEEALVSNNMAFEYTGKIDQHLGHLAAPVTI